MVLYNIFILANEHHPDGSMNAEELINIGDGGVDQVR